MFSTAILSVPFRMGWLIPLQLILGHSNLIQTNCKPPGKGREGSSTHAHDKVNDDEGETDADTGPIL